MSFSINVKVAAIAPLCVTGILFISTACLGFGGVGVGGISVNLGAGGLGAGGAAVRGGGVAAGLGDGADAGADAIGSDATGVSARADAGMKAATRDGAGAQSVGKAAAAQRAVLQERASLQVGFGPRQPDRGMGYALSYARATAAAASAVSSADKAVKTAVGSLPALPDVTAQAASTVTATVFSQPALDRTLSDPLAELSHDPKPAGGRALVARETITIAHGVHEQRTASRARTKPQVLEAQALPLIGRDSARDPRSTSIVFDQPGAWYGLPMIGDSAPRKVTLAAPAEHGWIVTGDFPDVQSSSLPMGATLLVMALSAASAYGFVRLTSSKCPQCTALIQRQSLGCHNCGARFRPSAPAEWRLSS